MPDLEIKPLESLVQRLFIPNAMLLLYLVRVSLGITVAMIVGHYTVGFFEGKLITALYQYGPYYDFPITIITIAIILVYERPIRRVFHEVNSSKMVSADELRTARRRILNEPLFLIGLDLITWLGAVGYYSLLVQRFAERPELARLLAVNSVLTAIISVVTTFFFLQWGLQRWLIPVFFPQGGLSRVPGVWRITLFTRLTALVMATSLVPLFILGVSLFGSDLIDLTGNAEPALSSHLSDAVFVELVLFMLTAIVLTYLVAGNLSRPFSSMVRVLAQIKRGHLDRRVKVVTNDEIGYTGEAINAMAAGLEEREKMRQSLYLAREVQQSLCLCKQPVSPM
jgi:HAMP domain-containing protein